MLGTDRGDGPDRMPVPPHDRLDDDQRAFLAELTSGPRGSAAGPFPALLRIPRLGRRVAGIGEYLRFDDSALDPATREFAILVIAAEWGQPVEWQVHRPLAVEAGVPEDVCDAIATGRDPGERASDRAAAVYALLRELIDTHRVSDAGYARAAAELTEGGVVELLVLAGYYTMLAMIMNTTRAPGPPLQEAVL